MSIWTKASFAALALTKRQLGDIPGALAQIWLRGTTETPDTIPGRLSLLEKAADYLRDNPGQAVEQKNFTGSRTMAHNAPSKSTASHSQVADPRR